MLEIGTGRGALTRELVGLTAKLEGYEIDKESYEGLRRELAGTSLVLHNEDAFKSSPEFDVLLSSLPYSESSAFVEWLSRRRYDRAVVLLQQRLCEEDNRAAWQPGLQGGVGHLPGLGARSR